MALIATLMSQLEIDRESIEAFLDDAPKKYKVYQIPKRRLGYRTIAHPAKMLKRYQRAFLRAYPLPFHPRAMAYITGRSIKCNAMLHREQPYLLKMDFQNFFNSITPVALIEMIKKVSKDAKLPLTQEERESLSALNRVVIEERIWFKKLLFWSKSRTINRHLMLSIGAPTSPSLSNLYLYLFDHLITTFCDQHQIIYSRYADDLFFSTHIREQLWGIPDKVNEILQKEYRNILQINEGKTLFASKKGGRFVTGITINNENELSLGRARKRYIKHLVHQFMLENLSREDIDHLKGLLAFSQDIEPLFIERLAQKYSPEILQEIKEYQYGV